MELALCIGLNHVQKGAFLKMLPEVHDSLKCFVFCSVDLIMSEFRYLEGCFTLMLAMQSAFVEHRASMQSFTDSIMWFSH